MQNQSRPYLCMNLIRHPESNVGSRIEADLRAHFSQWRYKEIRFELEVSVISTTDELYADPKQQIGKVWTRAENVLPVILLDQWVASDPEWQELVRMLMTEAERHGRRVLPVATDIAGLNIGSPEQALRFDLWPGADSEKMNRLIVELLHGSCQFFQDRLSQITSSVPTMHDFRAGSKKVQVFLSHSKHDADGVRVAEAFRRWLHENSSLASFFDLYDIPVGASFDMVLHEQVGESAMVAVRTDSYSAREMCRLEVLEAKHRNTPIVVADCLRSGEYRSMPHLGNLPVLLMSPIHCDRIGEVVLCLLDEMLVHLMWANRTESLRGDHANVYFTPRPPETVLFGAWEDLHQDPNRVIVFLGTRPPIREFRMFQSIAPNVRIESLGQWMGDTL